MRASFVEIGEDRYLATICTGSRFEDVLKDDAGRNRIFPSATMAVSAANAEIRRITTPAAPAPEKETRPQAVEDWHAERVERYQAEREQVDLIGVEVVRIRRRKFARPAT